MLRGSKSRNKVSVGEPAEGSLSRNPYLYFPEKRDLSPVADTLVQGSSLNLTKTKPGAKAGPSLVLVG